MITGINHIGIAVKSLENHIPFYRDVLKLQFLGIENVPDQKIRLAMFKVGNIQVELLEPTSPDSTINKYIENKGEGLHHIAYQSDNIENDIGDLIEKNIKMIEEKPRKGAHNTKIAFIHPKSSGKVLTEICQINDLSG
jgi:methylmalonyl-CoA/ethylmalonyl-CoA epimerase